MAVEGQTRFKVQTKHPYHIEEFVVTRTFTDWETKMLKQQQEQKQQRPK